MDLSTKLMQTWKKNLFWHYDAGIDTLHILWHLNSSCCQIAYLLQQLGLGFGIYIFFFSLYFVLPPFHVFILISLPLFLFIILFTLEYGIWNIWLFLDISCLPAIYCVTLPVRVVLQSFTHELHIPDLGIFLSHLAAQPALWRWTMGPAAPKQLEGSLLEFCHITSFMVWTIGVNNLKLLLIKCSA